MIVRDGWRGSTSSKGYVSTGKDMPLRASRNEQAYWMLSKNIEDVFGGTPATTMEIYRNITGPLGLTTSDTITLVRGSKNAGYLK